MTRQFLSASAAVIFTGAAMASDGPGQGLYGTEAVNGVYLLDEYPGVNKRVTVGGFELDVDRTHWEIDSPQSPGGSRLGGFRSRTINVSVSRVSSGESSGENVIGSYPVSTSMGVHGQKIVYGRRLNFLVQEISAIRYLFRNRQGQTICFEVRGIAPGPNWYRANKLILDNLSLPRA